MGKYNPFSSRGRRRIRGKLLPEKVDRELSRIGKQAEENLKDTERDVRNVLAETEDVLTGKTPDSIAAEMREAEAAQAEALEELKEKEAEKEERRSTAVGKRIASRRRARRAGRRSLLSGDRLGTGAGQPTQRTLG